MTRMSQERDAILAIRMRVQDYDDAAEAAMPSSESGSTQPSDSGRVHVGARSKAVTVANFMRLAADLSLKNFDKKLSQFLSEVLDENISTKRTQISPVRNSLLCSLYIIQYSTYSYGNSTAFASSMFV